MSPYRLSLITRLWLCHLTLAAAVALAWAWGWLDGMIATDTTHICALIAALFVAGAVLSTWRAAWLGRELDLGPESKSAIAARLMRGTDTGGRANVAEALKTKLLTRLSPIRAIANSLVLLGLIGTVVGFIQALAGVDPSKAADVSAITTMVATLVAGLSTALYTTLVGSVLNMYLMIYYRMLERAAAGVYTRALESEA